MLWLRYFLIVLAWLGSAPLIAQQTTNWGVIPIGQETTIAFSAYDISKNFTNQYTFSLQGTTDATYSVQVSFDNCFRGCGNEKLAFGIYDAKGGLVSDSGSAVLTSRDYVFEVKGTGMGSGNNLSYSGSMSFFVSAVPEPSDVLLLLAGLGFVFWSVSRRRNAMASNAGHSSAGTAGGKLQPCLH